MKKIVSSKKSITLVCIILICVSCIVLLGIFAHKSWARIQSTRIDGRPVEELIDSVISPDGLHKMDIYHNTGKGATVSESAVVIITANEGGEEWHEKKSWCLYYVYAYSNITASWIDNEQILIHNSGIRLNDGYVTLSIYQDEYTHRIK